MLLNFQRRNKKNYVLIIISIMATYITFNYWPINLIELAF